MVKECLILLRERREAMQTNETPLVSVVMPAYNSEAYIQSAIRSLQNQTVEDWELLVIEDGSKDTTPEVVAKLAQADGRIRLLPNEKNMGTARSRNRGMDLCRGRYIAFLDSDDCWHSTKLEKQIALAQSTGADILYTSYAIVDDSGEKRCPDFVVPERTDLKRMLRCSEIGCSTVMLAGQLAKEARFAENFYHEDYAMWLTLLQKGATAAGVSEVLVDYRYHADSRAADKFSSAKRRWRIYRDLLKLSLLKSGWYSMLYAVSGLLKYRKK